MDLVSILNLWWVTLLLLAWSLPWKGVALWKAAKNNHLVWFVVFLIVNLLAIP